MGQVLCDALVDLRILKLALWFLKLVCGTLQLALGTLRLVFGQQPRRGRSPVELKGNFCLFVLPSFHPIVCPPLPGLSLTQGGLIHTLRCLI